MPAFRYTTEKVNKNGSKETAVQEIDKDEILLGRGTSSDILLTGRLVSLRHAQLVVSVGSLAIQDLESLSGVKVNDQLVTRAELNVGDVVRIGSYQLEVNKDAGIWGFLERRDDAAAEEDIETFVAGQAKKLRFQSFIPSFSVLSVVISTVILIFFFAAPLAGKNISSWSSGPIANAHRMIEHDCAQCHAKPFVRVKDEQCIACHSLSEHAMTLPALVDSHPNFNYRCGTCHMEHNGDHGIIARDVKLCADCHGSLDKLLPGTGMPEIPSWDAHPEFRVSVPSEIEGVFKRVRLDSPDLSDPSQIKLNHKIHLEPDLPGKDGVVTLQCMDCHQLSADLKEIKPINFESHCSDCHSLEYDERLPGESVPHAKPNIVFNYLYAQYAQLFLTKEGEDTGTDTRMRRRMPGQQSAARGTQIEFTRSSVEEQARMTEEAIFTRTACHLCHMVSDVADSAPGESRFDVIAPRIPDKWMPASTFDHGAHQAISCESCHPGARGSEVTTDVLLPGKENCNQCHAETWTTGKVVSQCVTCHSYHEPLVLPEDQKREIERILLMSLGAVGTTEDVGGESSSG